MKSAIVTTLIFSVVFSGFSQMLEYNNSYFLSPIDNKIVLAGSFAELRSTHFHAGIDIKPQAADGVDTVRAAADGYVSRIKVQTGGYGHALYIDHPNGYTTVYAHLDTYHDTIKQYIEGLQKETTSYTLDIYPDSTKFLVQKGEVIGLMGNTGRSYAKHLHFEIRETKSEIPVNPALFGIKPPDTRPPRVLSIDIHKLSPTFHEQYSKTFYPKSISTGEYTINGGHVSFPAYICGLSIQSYDLMDGAPNRNGVYYQKTYVDDSLHSSFVFDKVSFDESKYINSHVDYKARKLHNRTMVRSYVLPGNQLSVYKNKTNKGVIQLYEGTPRKVKIILGDIEGNESIISFAISRDSVDKEVPGETYNALIKLGSKDTISAYGARIIFSQNALDRDLYLSFAKNGMVYNLGKNTDKLFQSARIELPVTGIPDSLLSYAGIHYLNDDEWINLGGEISGNIIYTYTSTLGNFKIGYDTIPPSITLRKFKNGIISGTQLKGTLDDNLKTGGMADEIKYNVSIDGEWVIAPYKSMTRSLTIPIPTSLEKGPHTLEITCEDTHGNKSKKKQTLTIK